MRRGRRQSEGWEGERRERVESTFPEIAGLNQ